MAKPYGKPVVNCLKCKTAIGEEHPYTWCAECGEQLNQDLLMQIPSQAALAAGIALAPNPAQSQTPSLSSSEGETVRVIGNFIIVVSIVAAAICILAFARVEVNSGSYLARSEWNTMLVTIYAAAGFNGWFFGYLLSKIGAILIRLDRR